MDPDAVTPYDPPRRFRRDSLLHEVEDGFERVADLAKEVGRCAGQVEDGARFGCHIVAEIDDKYGSQLRRSASDRDSDTRPQTDGHDADGAALHRRSSSAATVRNGKDAKNLLSQVRVGSKLDRADMRCSREADRASL